MRQFPLSSALRFAGAAVGLLLLSGGVANAKPVASHAPCSGEWCPLKAGDDQRRLNEAFLSDMTSDAEREKMQEIIKGHTQSGVANWAEAAKEYFSWRNAEASHSGSASPEAAQEVLATIKRAATAAQTDWQNTQSGQARKFRLAGEAAVKARLLDPSSAQFEWPYGFINGTWKPFLAHRVSGYWTCGRVNARNRMGGYVGSSTFVVVIDADGAAQFVDMDEGRPGMVDAQCSKSSALLPPAPAGMLDEPPTAQANVGTESVADQLEKLANLRDRKVITDAEFQAEKAKLLREH